MDWTAKSLLPLLRARGLRPSRKLGQNFLLDPNFLDAIVRSAEIGPEDGVIEIGTGPGNLTERLARAAGRVWSFEIDPELQAFAREMLAGRSNVTLVAGDGAAFGGGVDWSAARRYKVVSNLPYGPWQRLLVALMAEGDRIERYVLMIQRDAWERLSAGPGDPGYGPVGVLAQARFDLKLLRKAGPGLFHPRPRIESALVELRRKPGASCADLARLEPALRKLFAARRKKLPGDSRRVGEIPPSELVGLTPGAGRAYR